MRLLIFTVALCAPIAAGTLFSMRAVGPEGSVATAVAPDGSVSGYATNSNGGRTAFAFDGAVSMLGRDAGAYDAASGRVAGVIWGETGARATVWEGSAIRQLELMDSYALALNASGAVAGSAVQGGRTKAFVESGGVLSWIDAGAWSAAYDINDAGVVAGTYQNSRGRFRAFTWGQNAGVVDAGTLGGLQSWGQAVNASGAMVGTSMTATGYLHGFVYQGGRMTDLGTLGGTTSGAYDVNARGDIVGYSYDASGRSRAAVWFGGVLFDLNQLVEPEAGWTLEAAYGINDRGQIAGSGRWNGVQSAFLLDPTLSVDSAAVQRDSFQEGSESAVPVPGTLIATAIAAGIMVTIRYIRA